MTDQIKQETDMKEEKVKIQKIVESEPEEKITEVKVSEKKAKDKKEKDVKSEEKTKEKIIEEKPKDDKKEIKKQPPKKAAKKEEVAVNAMSLPISTKYSIAICRFIKGKKIDKAIEDLEQVIVKKKSVPMKGEIPHRKGPGKIGSGSGRFPKKASENFIKLLKSLNANAINHDVEEPVIVEAVANIAQRPFASGGRRKKRTHVTIKAREKKVVRRSAYPKARNAEAKKTKKKIKRTGII